MTNILRMLIKSTRRLLIKKQDLLLNGVLMKAFRKLIFQSGIKKNRKRTRRSRGRRLETRIATYT